MKCKCGCGKDIIPKSWHKYYRHEFLVGHRLKNRMTESLCDFCGKIFKRTLPKLPHKFCSRDCCGKFKYNKNIHICKNCNKKFHRRGKRCNKFCSSKCSQVFRSGKNNHNWAGGRNKTGNGYIDIKFPDHPLADSRGRVAEHRFVMSNHLKRPLLSTEIVHHINGAKDDNRIENLILFKSKSEHTRHHQLQKR